MSVVIQASWEIQNKHTFTDEGDKEFAYRINANGSLSVVAKESGKPVFVHREYGPNGYIWVEGKRFIRDIDKQAGTDGKLTLPPSKVQAF